MLARETLKHLLWEHEPLLGRAVFAAKCTVMARYPTNDNYYGAAYLWTYFGDPALRFKHRIQTGIAEPPAPPVRNLRVSAFPNPFTSATGVRITLAPRPSSPAPVLRIFSSSGRLVRSLVLPRPLTPEPYSLTWDGSDQSGTPVPPGTYLCRLQPSGFVTTLIRLP